MVTLVYTASSWRPLAWPGHQGFHIKAADHGAESRPIPTTTTGFGDHKSALNEINSKNAEAISRGSVPSVVSLAIPPGGSGGGAGGGGGGGGGPWVSVHTGVSHLPNLPRSILKVPKVKEKRCFQLTLRASLLQSQSLPPHVFTIHYFWETYRTLNIG